MRVIIAIFASLLWMSSAQADINCWPASAFIEAKTDSEVLNLINQQPTASKRLNRRKTFEVYSARSVSTDGCDVSGRFNVKLKRKIRRDASGHMDVKARINRFTGCFEDIKVTELKLSYTLRVGEAIYRHVANKKLPETLCL